jgi:large subunit ribosomal protein L9
MEVILTQDVNKLGKENELVNVKPGYARNFLMPRKLAVLANESEKKKLLEVQKQDLRREDKLMKQINVVVESLKSTTFKIGAKTGTSGKIFGAVTTHMIADAIKKQKSISVDRKRISINEEVKNVGTYTAKIELHKEVSVDITFDVIAE